MTPPNSRTANDVINELGAMVGNINDNAGLLAAQALVLQARGRDDFAQQQITKAFDISVNNNQELVNWSGNLTRYFEGEPPSKEIEFQNWLDLFIARRLVKESEIDSRAFVLLDRLIQYEESAEIQTRAYRIKGSTYFAQKKYEEATAVWTEALQTFPDDWEMNNNLAYALSEELDRPEEALEFAQRAIDQNIARSEAYETMAGVYRKLGKYDEAEQMIEIGSNYIQSIPARVTMILSTAKLALARNDLVDAKSRLNDAESAVRSAPTSYPNLEEDIAELAQEINSAGG
jgi:tetratricopeptide (TPR) repeat protein